MSYTQAQVKTNQVLNDTEIKVDINSVCIGMYVVSLDVPWGQTRFLLEGLMIETDREIAELRKHCAWVIASKNKSKYGVFKQKSTPYITAVPSPKSISKVARDGLLTLLSDGINTIASEIFSILNIFSFNPVKENYSPQKAHKTPASIDLSIKEDFTKIRKAKVIRTQFKNDEAVTDSIVNYLVTESVHTEAKQAQVAQSGLQDATVLALSADLSDSQLHESIDIAKDALSDVVDSIGRNPDAIQLVTKIKSLDQESYQHAIDVSLLLIALGRELCLPKSDLIELGLGGLLHDVGEIKLPENASNKRIKNITKFKIYKDHIDEGMKIAIKANHSAIVKQIIANHHEYYDGTGYPRQLVKGQIGLYGNMAVIVDSYVSLTSGRCCDTAVPPNKALDIMYRQKGKLFHPQLLDQFIQIVGLYPVGSMVRLSSGDIGLVIKQNKAWRLKPVVMLVMDKHKAKLPKPIHIDLMELSLTKKPLFIASELPIDSFDIKADDYF